MTLPAEMEKNTDGCEKSVR